MPNYRKRSGDTVNPGGEDVDWRKIDKNRLIYGYGVWVSAVRSPSGINVSVPADNKFWCTLNLRNASGAWQFA